ncbi:lactate utilization protein [Methylovirgula ligni]|uniref:L-lactate dehydrogenase complex protein LldG n=1 Tax=Methylovirgula ligni TaxID=569860 RepID=A0A3D9YUB1_9HYPH|nr:lactate utilization protein [Methylovirgula ligni]QAY96118.1 lactate utilization protein [Methylovirgula ligni]REF86196.1 L-lactate dehydrogenase complex protein LldG [Methylovirgula ligni]
MSDRAKIFAGIRRALGVTGAEDSRRHTVNARLAEAPESVIPARGRVAADKVALFRAEAERVFATVEDVASAEEIPARIADFLRAKNLPLQLRKGADPYLAALPWESAALRLDEGRAQPEDRVGLSHAFAGIAETGTLALVSGPDNPTTLNFLPETHIVVVEAWAIVGDYEAFWAKLRAAYGEGTMPRTVNFITGPSRSADIEQTLLLGAHGPRALHILIVGGS